MALDIYCGTLSRYYLGDWQNIFQSWAESQGLEYSVNRKEQEGLDTSELSEADKKQLILDWQEGLKHFLKSQQDLDCAWSEADDAPYLTDRPGWSAYWLVLLWALYQEQGETPFDEVPEGFQLEQDPVFMRRSAKDYESEYPMLNSEADLFLPITEAVFLNGADPFGHPVGIASSIMLLADLELLNERTWQASEAEIASWRESFSRTIFTMADDQPVVSRAQAVDRFEEVAKYGFAILYKMTRFAVEHQLPMRLDW